MSVSLMVAEPKDAKWATYIVPVATEEVFARIWLWGADEVKARWIPLFQSGVEIESRDFGDVIEELLAFRAWVLRAPLPSRDAASVEQRVEALTRALRRIADEIGERGRVFVG